MKADTQNVRFLFFYRVLPFIVRL